MARHRAPLGRNRGTWCADARRDARDVRAVSLRDHGHGLHGVSLRRRFADRRRGAQESSSPAVGGLRVLGTRGVDEGSTRPGPDGIGLWPEPRLRADGAAAAGRSALGGWGVRHRGRERAVVCVDVGAVR